MVVPHPYAHLTGVGSWSHSFCRHFVFIVVQIVALTGSFCNLSINIDFPLVWLEFWLWFACNEYLISCTGGERIAHYRQEASARLFPLNSVSPSPVMASNLIYYTPYLGGYCLGVKTDYVAVYCSFKSHSRTWAEDWLFHYFRVSRDEMLSQSFVLCEWNPLVSQFK